ncbi:inner membrane protein [Polystyrenella longa]|uniref:UPF0056 membrane protein n=1 Tax=Polystyrenella longa TaxID=2528007 RepID=A0A518CSW3_9PLAN|nr:MarC family protein [Polystyrenella longa]QDU82321.1 inner membrane protein [Polystyrenella longa]
MTEFYQNAITVFMGFFAIMNPLANTAVFLGLAGNRPSAERAKIAVKALLVAFVIVALFCVIGKALFELFGITLPALKIAGGILVFMIGYQMLHGKKSKMHHPAPNAGAEADYKEEGEEGEGEEDEDIAISPLALPILAGPGTLATAMNFSAGGGFTKITVTIVAFAILCLITLGCFLMGEKLVNRLGASGLQIVSQLMGLIMAVIGTQMFIEGVAAAMKRI